MFIVCCLQCFSLVPDRPVRRNNYMCDKQFHLEELKQLCERDDEEEFVAVCLINGRASELWLVSNLQQKLVESIGTTTQKNHKKGGMVSTLVCVVVTERLMFFYRHSPTI